MTADAPDGRPTSAVDDTGQFKRFLRFGEVDPRQPGLDPAFGVPPRPGGDAPELLRRFWDRVFGSRLNLRLFEATHAAAPSPAIRRRAAGLAGFPGSVEDSRNWAGAYATANGGDHLQTMFGIWQIPLSLAIPPGGSAADFACSVWMGLDGQRRYFNSSLPQIGTLSTVSATGRPLAGAWVQWWERDDPDNEILPLDLPVSPGETVACFLHATGPHEVWFVMVNLSAPEVKQALAFTGAAPTSVDGAQPAVFGATAEWIVEQPTKLHKTTMYKLPDFGRCHIEGLALQAPAIGRSQWFEGRLRDLSYARTIRMFEQRADPPRTAIIAMPHRAGPTGVNVTYGGF